MKIAKNENAKPLLAQFDLSTGRSFLKEVFLHWSARYTNATNHMNAHIPFVMASTTNITFLTCIYIMNVQYVAYITIIIVYMEYTQLDTRYIGCMICVLLLSSSSIIIIHHPSSIIHHPSSIIHHPSSIIHHPSSIIHHPSSIIHHPSSIIHHPSSIIIIIIIIIIITIKMQDISLMFHPPTVHCLRYRAAEVMTNYT